MYLSPYIIDPGSPNSKTAASTPGILSGFLQSFICHRSVTGNCYIYYTVIRRVGLVQAL